MTGSVRAYCRDQVRRLDHDRYLTGLFAPVDRRADLFALYAFNLEIAKTADLVSEPMIGRIRLEWWREAIAEIYEGQPRAHAVIAALSLAIRERHLTRDHFERLIAARETDLDDWQPATLEELEDYASETSVPLVSLALEILDQGNEAAQAAAVPVGVAWALTGLLRAVHFHARQKRIRLPRDIMSVHGVRPGPLLELRSSPELSAAVKQIAARAREHLAGLDHSPRAVQAALLPATLARGYLAILERAGYDPFDPRVQRPDPAAAWRLTWVRLRGRI